MPKILIFSLVFFAIAASVGAFVYTSKSTQVNYFGNNFSESNYWFTPQNNNIEAIEMTIEYNYTVVKDIRGKESATGKIDLVISAGLDEEIVTIPSMFDKDSLVLIEGEDNRKLQVSEFIGISDQKPLLSDIEISLQELKAGKIIPSVRSFKFLRMDLADRPTI